MKIDSFHTKLLVADISDYQFYEAPNWNNDKSIYTYHAVFNIPIEPKIILQLYDKAPSMFFITKTNSGESLRIITDEDNFPRDIQEMIPYHYFENLELKPVLSAFEVGCKIFEINSEKHDKWEKMIRIDYKSYNWKKSPAVLKYEISKGMY